MEFKSNEAVKINGFIRSLVPATIRVISKDTYEVFEFTLTESKLKIILFLIKELRKNTEILLIEVVK